MFTGIIQDIGTVVSMKVSGKSGRISLLPGKPLDSPLTGESISVNGVCLTLEKAERGTLNFYTLAETLSKTNLGSLKKGFQVNLERALSPSDRLGGHFVTGHVDAPCPLIKKTRKSADTVLVIHCPENLRAFIVEKGSIAVDGVSLTVVEAEDKFFSVHLIPETLNRTCLAKKSHGDLLNIETDLLAKYVCRAMDKRLTTETTAKNNLTLKSLLDAGWDNS